MRGGRPTHVKLHGAGELAPDASLLPRVCTLQWSPGSLPGYTTGSVAIRAVMSPLQWSPGSLPGYTRPMYARTSRISSFNGARDHSRDTLTFFCSSYFVSSSLQWSPGLLPRYTPWRAPKGIASTTFNGAWDYSRDTLADAVNHLSNNILQWSPGLLPGYTQAGVAVGRDGKTSMEPGITPGIHRYQFLPRPDAGCKAHFRQPPPKASLALPIRGAPTKKSFYSK